MSTEFAVRAVWSDDEVEVDPEQREHDVLLTRVTAHVLQHGLSALTVRVVARSAGCEPGLLAHHFGTMDELVGLVLAMVRGRLSAIVNETTGIEPTPTIAVWTALTTDAGLRLLRVLLEAQGLTVSNPDRYEPFVNGTLADWRDALTRGGRDAATADLIVATVHGAVMQRLSTGPASTAVPAAIVRLSHAV